MNFDSNSKEFQSNDPDGFQKALAAYKGFEKYVTLHQKLLDTSDQIFQSLSTSGEPSLTFVVGPTAVGKTTVKRFVQKVIVSELTPGLPAYQVPLLSVELPAVGPRQQFDWRDTYARCLMELGDPLMDKKLLYPTGGIRRGEDGSILTHTGTTTSALRAALEKALTIRKPYAVLLDEAHHLVIAGSGVLLIKQVELLKSLANTTKIPIVLFGTYDMLPLLRLSGQLSRRSRIVMMHRYHADRPEELGYFLEVLEAFQTQLPLPTQPELKALGNLIYERSVGCVGLVKSWLGRALWQALVTRAKVITTDILKATAPEPWQALDIIRECKKGESSFGETERDLNELRKELNPDPPVPKPEEEPKPKTIRNPNPFKRKPSRDPISDQDQENAA